MTEDLSDLEYLRSLVKKDIDDRMSLRGKEVAEELQRDKLQREAERRNRIDAGKRRREEDAKRRIQREETELLELEEEVSRLDAVIDAKWAIDAYLKEKLKLEIAASEVVSQFSGDARKSAMLIALSQKAGHNVWTLDQAVEATKVRALIDLKMNYANKLSPKAQYRFLYILLGQ